MSKIRRSARLVDITHELLTRPHTLIPLTFFAERYEAAKSSISEDLAIVKEVFEKNGIGHLLTVAGAAGGVKFIPYMPKEKALAEIRAILRRLEDPERLLPGGYLYMTDVLGEPRTLRQIGCMFATVFADCQADVVMTMETKGIPLAHATAEFLNLPVVVVRRDNKVTEGSAVSINYVSGSSKRIQTMSLSRRALTESARVLIIDDFMKAGGTIRGMIDLLREFQAHVVGIGVFVESAYAEERLVDGYVSLARLTEVDVRERRIRLEPGNYFA
ncbi:MAG TPA: pur operon repressor [Calditerricola sp.]